MSQHVCDGTDAYRCHSVTTDFSDNVLLPSIYTWCHVRFPNTSCFRVLSRYHCLRVFRFIVKLRVIVFSSMDLSHKKRNSKGQMYTRLMSEILNLINSLLIVLAKCHIAIDIYHDKLLGWTTEGNEMITRLKSLSN